MTGIKTKEQAATWIISLYNFGKPYHDFLNEKTLLQKGENPDGTQWEYTHLRVRKAYKILEHL
ncbi:hypothetical protein CpMRi49_08980 [Corynebacterium ulcerans]|uniref:hypothetical protein n=1 Tax=Corynebacterium ulcerans TaxID=65058 RepID=UPI0002EEABB7|nr:hypothetical protein [Corynebacterium ulcerans]MBH5297804.1 hypothetical protein [Corynebacterium ulcerans]MBL4943455.1 hypothetical protein [Corynebacterium ulcerans]MDK8887566.1 hypothetical protein [Corynebacterium ulcerans]NOM01783.1 hypothetical protein [Corynebacterium ulcerans]QGZ26072.1 hypothetical protein CpMRi49_08980 [Corynebacterium ulcerans]